MGGRGYQDILGYLEVHILVICVIISRSFNLNLKKKTTDERRISDSRCITARASHPTVFPLNSKRCFLHRSTKSTSVIPLSNLKKISSYTDTG